MKLKARKRFTIHQANKSYTSFVKRGTDTYGESIRNRAFFYKLTQHRKKK